MITLVVTSAKPRVLTQKTLDHLARRLSRALHVKGVVSVGVRFVSLQEIQTLNQTFRRKNRPTDVLSFAAQTDIQIKKDAQNRSLRAPFESYWGDLAICPDYAKEEAVRRSLPLREELLRLLTHGVLHLAGYDHVTEVEELNMFGLQEHIIAPFV